MPQLDFFTFPHQYLVATICFCGVYYFNLLIFFPKIKYFQLNKIFSINALAANVSIIEGDYVDIFATLLLQENILYSTFFLKTRKLTWKFLFWKLSMNYIQTTRNNQNLFLMVFFNFFLIFFFFKNFLVFNAEKLMLIYFLLVLTLIFFFSKIVLKTFLTSDIKKLLDIILELELEGNKTLLILKESFRKLKSNVAQVLLEFLILKNLELKLFNWINDKR